VERVLVIPAAGTGSRLGASVPKLLVPVNGRPMIEHLLVLYSGHVGRVVLVVAPSALGQVSDVVRDGAPPVALVVQDRPTGMLDAILLARNEVEASGARRVLVTWCDQVAISPRTVAGVVSHASSHPEPALVMPTSRQDTPYIHLQRDAGGRIVRVLHRREGDEMPDTGETDAGVFDLSAEAYHDWLPIYARRPEIGARTGERNFVPFVAFVAERGRVVTVPCAEPEEAIGVNTREELDLLEAHLRARQPR
jgi:bifunctional UDP-N-acetylglucosamine pyrophosphorylase/glucosamine-1-phosphate N-acetyltransferase